MMDAVEYALWFLAMYGPPMLSNAAPVLVNGVIPIDKGRFFVDGRRLLGDGKTVEGFVTGAVSGFVASIPAAIVIGTPLFVLVGLAASIAALLGDIAGSFLKRRLGLERGAPLFLVDQLDFMLAATGLYAALGYIGDKWIYVGYTMVLVIMLHIATNNVAYYLGLKNTRW